MNASVFVVLFAVVYSVSANCGCLKCSKDLAIAGHTVPVPGCGPVKVIYRGAPGESLPGHELPVTIQAPVPTAPVDTEVEEVKEDLTYKVLPQTTVTEFIEQPSCGFKEYKVQAPLAVPALPAVSIAAPLKSCVDRVVLPGPSPVVEYASGPLTETIVKSGFGPGYVAESFGPMYESRRWLKRGYNREIDIVSSPALAAPALAGPALAGPLLPAATTIVEQPLLNSCCNKSPLLLRRPSCAPAVDVITNSCDARKSVIYRYRNALIPIAPTKFALALTDENINKKNIQILENVSTNNTLDRKKREVPFLKHGYKFFMNMLPDFIQEPIKTTVNSFALTHPDKRLRALYNQPKELSLREKILLRNRKNMKLLKKKLLGHRLKKNLIKKPPTEDHSIEREARTFASKLKEPMEYPKYPWLNEIHSRFLKNEENLNSELIPTRLSFDKHSLTSETSKNPQFTESEKALFLKKLKILNEGEKSRIKRSTFFQNYMNQFTQDPQNHVILGSSELALPFYQVKIEDGSEESQDDEYYDSNDEDVSREQMLRNVIRKELRKYKYEQSNEGNGTPKSLNFNDFLSHTPLFYLISLPVRFMHHFNEISKQAAPILTSVPKMKKYFRDFGKNLKKNVLHLASDVIGDFDNLDSKNNILANIVGPLRHKRSVNHPNGDDNAVQVDERILEQYSLESDSTNTKDGVKKCEENRLEQYEPDYSLVFEYDANENVLDAKVRNKRYILKMVDEDEVEDFLVEKLSQYFAQTDERHPRNERVKAQRQYSQDDCPACQMLRRQMASRDSEENYGQKKVVLEQLKPKLIIDNNGLPFLEIDGYKKPMLRNTRKNRRKQHKTQDSFESFQNPYYHSGEFDSEKIGYLIDHARDHVESSYNERFSEMPVKIVKTTISQLLLEMDLMVHMDFDKYDEIYDNLIALQHIKSAVEQDWKRLIISKRIDDMNGKIALLGKFQEMQHFKDMTLRGVAYALNEENENKFITKKLLKILVRLQKLQCVINQVVENVQAKLHMGSKFDTRKEVKYVDFFAGLNFVNAKTRNEMIDNLKKDRDLVLQQHIELLDLLKKLLVYDGDSEKLNEEASLLWEMRNIEKLQRSAIEDMVQRLSDGYKIKKELKILFDLLKRYEICESEQRKLLSQFEEGGIEESSEEYSEEEVNMTRNKKKFDIEEYRSRLQERLRKRKMLLRKKLKNNRTNRKSKVESYESDEEE